MLPDTPPDPATKERRVRAGVKEALVREELVIMGRSPFGLVRGRRLEHRLAVNIARPALWPADDGRLSHESVFGLSHER